MCELAKRIEQGKDYNDVKNFWIKKGGKIIKNEIRQMPNLLDV